MNRASISFHEADGGAQHFVLRDFDSRGAQGDEGTPRADARHQENTEARRSTAKDLLGAGVKEPPELHTLYSLASELHGDLRGGGEACQGEQHRWWRRRQHGVHTVPTKDILPFRNGQAVDR